MASNNNANFIGRLAKDLEVMRYEDGSLKCCRVYLIVDRLIKQRNQSQDADVFPVMFFNELAVRLDKHFSTLKAGQDMIVSGSVQNNVFVDKVTRKETYSVSILAENFHVGSPAQGNRQKYPKYQNDAVEIIEDKRRVKNG